MDQSSDKASLDKLGEVPAYPVESRVEARDGDAASYGFTPEEEKRIIRRVDRRLVTTLGVLYCVSLMDRTNLGAANIAGMSVELLLTGNRYVSPLSLSVRACVCAHALVRI